MGLVWLGSFVVEYRGIYRYGDEPVGVRSYHGLRWTGASAWVEDRDLTQVLNSIGPNSEPRDVLAHAQPGILTLFTGRPSTRPARGLDVAGLREFLARYRVAYVLLKNEDGYRRRY